MLDNSLHYKKIEEILTQQTDITDKNPLKMPGIRRSFVLTLNEADLKYFENALIFDNPNLGIGAIANPMDDYLGAHLRKGHSPHQYLLKTAWKAAPIAAQNSRERFISALFGYFHGKHNISLMALPFSAATSDTKDTICICPQPYNPVNVAKMTALIRALQNKKGNETSVER